MVLGPVNVYKALPETLRLVLKNINGPSILHRRKDWITAIKLIKKNTNNITLSGQFQNLIMNVQINIREI